MGHYCRICDRERPNERFSGRGHKTHVCKECQRMPKNEREAIEQQDEIFRYLKQSHISPTNVARLKMLAESPHPRTKSWAGIALAVAEVKPHKKRRLKILSEKRPDLLRALVKTEVVNTFETVSLIN
jgi:hypothetical protein